MPVHFPKWSKGGTEINSGRESGSSRDVLSVGYWCRERTTIWRYWTTTSQRNTAVGIISVTVLVVATAAISFDSSSSLLIFLPECAVGRIGNTASESFEGNTLTGIYETHSVRYTRTTLKLNPITLAVICLQPRDECHKMDTTKLHFLSFLCLRNGIKGDFRSYCISIIHPTPWMQFPDRHFLPIYIYPPYEKINK